MSHLKADHTRTCTESLLSVDRTAGPRLSIQRRETKYGQGMMAPEIPGLDIRKLPDEYLLTLSDDEGNL